MKQHPHYGFRLGLAAFTVAVATLIAGESRADIDLGQGIVLAPGAQIPVPPGVTSDPIALSVNCGAGGKVAQAVSLKPLTTSRLTITIQGTCTEAVDNLPGGVTLQAASSGDGLQAPSSSTDPVLGISGTGIMLNGLTITGGVTGLRGRSGAAFTGNNLVIQGASNTNVLMNHSVATLNNPTIQNSSNDGLEVYWSSTIFLNGGSVQQNAGYGINAGYAASVDVFGGAVLQSNGLGGAQAFDGAAVYVSNATVTKNGTASSGATGGLEAGTGGHVRVSGSNTSIVSNTVDGISAFRGGSVAIDNAATVANNSRHGVLIYSGAAGFVRAGLVISGNGANGIYLESGEMTIGDGSGPATIQGNGQNGIFMRTNSVATFSNSGNQIINNTSWGILCTGSPSVPLIFGTVGTVSGNGSGQIGCNTSPNPGGQAGLSPGGESAGD
jgi:hypothetical protein